MDVQLPVRDMSRPSPFFIFSGLCAAAVALYWPSIKPLVHQWSQTDESLGHGSALFLLVCAWAWTRRQTFNHAAQPPSLYGALLVGAISLGWLVVSIGDIELLEQLMMLPMFLALAVLSAGWRAAGAVAGPVLMLLFCLPLFDSLNDQLVDLSAWSVGEALALTSLTSFINGNTITLPGGSIVIADGCSGLRYLVIGLATANLSASMNKLSMRDQLALNLITVIAMLCVNWARILIIVFVAYATNMESSLVRNHEAFGWVVFAVGLIPVVLYARRAAGRDA
jgi:exosortase